jgi:hypothetical protein
MQRAECRVQNYFSFLTLNSSLWISTVNLCGRVINFRILENFDTNQQLNLDVSGYAAGQYLVRLVTMNGSLTKSFVVVR